MVMTKDSFTGDPFWDKMVMSMIIIRITLLFGFVIVNSAQLYFEVKLVRWISDRSVTLLCLVLAPLFRCLSMMVYIFQHTFDVGSVAFLFSVLSVYTFLILWIMISGTWITLLYTFFISEEVRFRNSKIVWRCAFGIGLFIALFGISVCFMSFLVTRIASVYSAIGFIFILVFGGGLILVNLFILAHHLKKSKDPIFASSIEGNTDGKDKQYSGKSKPGIKYQKYTQISKRIFRLAMYLVVLIVLTLVRELVFFVLAIPMNSNIRHTSTFYVMLLDFSQLVIIMMGMTTKPLNYLLFRPVRSLYSPKSSKQTANTSDTNIKTSYTNGNTLQQDTYSLQLSDKEQIEQDNQQQEQDQKEPHKDGGVGDIELDIVKNDNSGLGDSENTSNYSSSSGSGE